MLKQLTIQNYVLVSSLDVPFQTGLTTITGESGAGKSILLGALGLLLGERARADVVSPGADKANISAEFDISHITALQDRLATEELVGDPPEICLIRRVVNREGRSRAFVNGTPVTLQQLQSIAGYLVDIYGQNEHQKLADPRVQLTLLDEYAGHTETVQTVGALYRQWQQTCRKIADLEAENAAQTDRQELLTYQLRELDELDLADGEFAKVEAEHKRLAQASELIAIVGGALDILDAIDEPRHAIAEIDAIDDDHADLASAQSTLASAVALIDDALRDLRRYQSQIVVDAEALALIEARLNAIVELARKHRTTPEGLFAHTCELRGELDKLAAGDSDLDALRERETEEHNAYDNAAAALSQARRKHAKRFAKAITKSMRRLGIVSGELTVEFTDAVSERGHESVDFLVKTNEKFAAGPLSKIASGGEQTRIALSIQIVTAATSSLPCLVLDEADVGVGGTTADTVGRILRDLAGHTQIICVTHAPQVAALGNNHLRVHKSKSGTVIEPLDESNRVEELARMLAGADVTAKSRDYASTLLAEASP
jgi:DNA repair protein RecN (Recombination protein N)